MIFEIRLLLNTDGAEHHARVVGAGGVEPLAGAGDEGEGFLTGDGRLLEEAHVGAGFGEVEDFGVVDFVAEEVTFAILYYDDVAGLELV